MPGTKCTTDRFFCVLVSCICILGHCLSGTFHSWCCEQNATSDIGKHVALLYWCPLSLALWQLSLVVPVTKYATHLFPCVFCSGMCILGYCECDTFPSWCLEPNITVRYYKACCPALLVSSSPATMAAFIPGTRNQICHTASLFCIALSYLYA